MSAFQAVFLGVIQGVTEFLPISSSGHLIFLPEIFDWGESPLVFDTTLHLGTALALILFFWRDLIGILVKDRLLGLYVFVGLLPAGVAGFLFKARFEGLRSVGFVVLFLVFGSLLMLSAEFFSSKRENLTVLKSLIIGLFQVLALFPGVSRSGSTISGGMFVGLTRERAARFSFLMSIPIVVLAGGYEGLTSIQDLDVSFDVLFLGFIASFVSGLLSIKLLLAFLKTNRLSIFILYRVLLAVALVIFFV